jgi:uncharacterized protein (DUF58 family)
VRTRPGAAILAAASFFLVTGLALQRWEIISLMVPLILMVALAPIMFPRSKIDLRISRTFDQDHPQKGGEVDVRLNIQNLGDAFDMVQLEDLLPEGVELVKGRNRFPLGMAREEEVEVSYRLAFPNRGKFHFTGVEATVTDVLFATSRTLGFDLPGAVEVTPRIQEMKRLSIQPHKVRMHAGNIRSKLLGPGIEFFALRDYRPGDTLRHVNWKASARLDTLVTNEYETERSGDVTIIVDARTIGGEDGLEATVEAAASLSSYFLKQRDRVGMVILGHVVDVIKSDYGKRQLQKIVDHLTEARPGAVRSAVSIRLALNRYFRGDSMLVLITALNDRGMVETAKELVGKGHHLIVISPRPVWEGPKEDRAAELVYRMGAMRRADALYELGHFCKVVDWETGKPLTSYFREVRACQTERTC